MADCGRRLRQSSEADQSHPRFPCPPTGECRSAVTRRIRGDQLLFSLGAGNQGIDRELGVFAVAAHRFLLHGTRIYSRRHCSILIGEEAEKIGSRWPWPASINGSLVIVWHVPSTAALERSISTGASASRLGKRGPEALLTAVLGDKNHDSWSGPPLSRIEPRRGFVRTEAVGEHRCLSFETRLGRLQSRWSWSTAP